MRWRNFKHPAADVLWSGDMARPPRRGRGMRRENAMTYRAPVADMSFALKHAAGLTRPLDDGLYADLTEDVVDAVLEEAGKFATDVIAPLNRIGDRHGTPFGNGRVTMPPGWKDAYTAWAAGGWNGLASTPDWGGQGLPHALNA